MHHRAGVHITREQVRVVLWDGKAILRKHKQAHDADTLHALVASIVAAVEACAAGAKVRGVGVALPATVHPDHGVVVACHELPWLVGARLVEALSSHFGDNVRADAEAHCAAWGDHLSRDKEHRRLPTLGFTPTLYGGGTLIVDGELHREDDGAGFGFNALLQRASRVPHDEAADGPFHMATLIRHLAEKHGLKLKKKDPVVEVCKKAQKEHARALAIIEEAGAPVGLMVRSICRSLELSETDRFLVLHADTCDETLAFMMPIAVAAGVYLAQRSGQWGSWACAVGAAQL
jgi:predicted NBD/HSP70 family sugar kinase